MTTSLTPSPQRKRGSTAIGRRQTPNKLVQGAFLGTFVGLLGAWLSWPPFGFDVEERMGFDQLFLWRGKRQPPEEVIIIGIDARSATKTGWPSKPEKWPRGLHAELIRKLTGACAKVIVYDLFFAAARDPEQDRQLAQALREAGNVVLVSHLGIAEDILPASLSRQALQIQRKPLSLFAESAVGVAPLPLPNEAGGVTGLWLFKPDAGDLPSLPALAFHVYAREAQEEWLAPFRALISKPSPSAGRGTSRPAFSQELTETMRWLRGFFNQERTREQAMVLSVGEGGRRLLRSRLSRLYQAPDFQYLNFFGPARSVTTIDFPAALALSDETGGYGPMGFFSGKAVFVGVSETSPVEQKDRDIFDTVYTDSNRLKLSGVEIAATAFANLLENKPVRRLSALPCLALLALLGLIAGLLWCGVTTTWALGISVVMMTGYFWLVFSLFSREAFWLPWIVPSVQLMIAGGAGVAIERRNLQRHLVNLRLSLAEWLSPRVVAEIPSDPAITRQATGLVYGTCLSIKVDGSLMGSQSTDPIVSSQLMSDCFRLVDKSVTRYGGVLAEQTRHSRLSLWVATKPDSLLRRQACKGALDIESAFGGFQRERNCHSLSARIRATCRPHGRRHLSVRGDGELSGVWRDHRYRGENRSTQRDPGNPDPRQPRGH